MLTLDPVKLAACKDDNEKLILALDTLKGELSKEALARDADGMVALKKQIDAMSVDFEKRMAERFPQFSLPGVPVGEGKNQVSIARLVTAYRRNAWEGAGAELEYVQQVEKSGLREKAMSAGIDTAGGIFVTHEVSSKLIEKLLPEVIAFKLGVNQVDLGTVGSLTFPRETGTPTATWVGEMQTAVRSQSTYDKMTVSPHAVSAKCDISNLLLMLTGGGTGVDQRFINSASRQFRLAFDRAILIGANSPQGPVGIVNTPGINTSSSASITFNKIVAFVSKLRKADALIGSKLGWAMTPDQLELIETMVDSSSPNQQLVRRAVDGGVIDRLRGYRFETSTQMGTTGLNTLIFGAWDMATFFTWFGGAFTIHRSDVSDLALDNDLTRIVLRAYADVGVDQPSAFVVASD